jgi:hypothetical protein
MDFPNFTQEQFDYITKLIESKVDAKIKKGILSYKKEKKIVPIPNYHSYAELKTIIASNIDYLKTEINYEPFRMQGIAHCVRKIILPLDEDLSLLPNGMIRIDSQISGLIGKWKDAPWYQDANHPRHLYWK